MSPLTILTDESVITRDSLDGKWNGRYSPPPSEIRFGSTSEHTLRLTPPRKQKENVFTPPKTPGKYNASSFSLSFRSRSSSHSSVASYVDIPRPQSGFLMKNCKNLTSLWVSRYFTLENGILSNFFSDINHGTNNTLKKFALKDFNMIADPTKNQLTLESIKEKSNIPTRKIVLYASSKENFNIWENALSKHMVYYKNSVDVSASKNHNFVFEGQSCCLDDSEKQTNSTGRSGYEDSHHFSPHFSHSHHL